MTMVTDPICGMRIDTDDAVATTKHEGTTYYFCSQVCHDTFVADRSAEPAARTPERLSGTELAEQAFTTPERIAQLVDLGILSPDEGTFSRQDVMRVRVVGQLESAGIEVEALARGLASGHLSLGYMEAAGRIQPRSHLTFEELATQTGIPFADIERLYLAFGLSRPTPDERVRAEDMDTLMGMRVLFEAGLSSDDVIRLARLWGDNVRRMAQYLTHHFHTTVEERFRQQGMGDNQAYEAAILQVGLRVGRSGEDLLGWLFRRHSDVFATEHQFQHVETALELAGVRPRPRRSLEAAVFADISGFTELTERSGDEAAAGVALTLAEVAADTVSRHRGEVVKLLGDGVLLHFDDPADAVRASLDIIETVPTLGLPPAHVGVQAGPMLYEEGDYFGRTVNLASRIANRAGPGQVLVGESVADNVTEDGFRFVEAGEFPLKGIAGEVRVLQAVRTD